MFLAGVTCMTAAFLDCATKGCNTIVDVNISCPMQCFMDNLMDTAAMLKCETDTCGVSINVSRDGTKVSDRGTAKVSKRQTPNLDCFFANPCDKATQLA